jgi:hypothetical protein
MDLSCPSMYNWRHTNMRVVARRKWSDLPHSLDEALARIPSEATELYQWFAGFVEGDGCLSICKSGGRGYREYKDRFGITVKVLQKDVRPLMILRKNFGGLIRGVTRKDGNRRRRKYLEWSVFANEALAMITVLRPYLQIKTGQADCLIALQSSVNAWRGKYGRGGRIPEEIRKYRNSLYEECRRLNSKEHIEAINSASGEFGEHLWESEVTPSQAAAVRTPAEGVTATKVSANDNPSQERPTLTPVKDEIA